MISFTVTLYLWWLWAYLAIGVGLFFPLNLIAAHRTSELGPMWPRLVRSIKRRPLIVPIQIVLWPLSTWETLR